MAIGRALYSRDELDDAANRAALRAIGINPEDFDDEVEKVYVWPEHVRAWFFFCDSCSTQWRTGMSGWTGLDYSAVLDAIKFEEPDREKAKELFEQIKHIERGALQELSEQRAEAERKNKQ